MHHKTIIRSSEWKEFKTSRSELANELLESVLNEQNSNDLYTGDMEDIDNCINNDIPSSSSLLNNYSINGMNSSSSFVFDSNLINNNSQSYSSSSSLNSSFVFNGSTSNLNNALSFSSQSSVSLLNNNNNNRNGIIQSSGIFSSQRAAREASNALAQDTSTNNKQTPSIRKRFCRSGAPVSASNFTRSETSSLISN